ncbi:hypothetical protein RND71_006003 [Anisodus tanguticus]|uniref:General transcription factor 3C polypeptide 3 n=1 Tax=Anisodus tanguticus TaxID=243964 RepID=A0AAE1VSV3_9SOLA|nr:hypothetical protein RND71_006003 [Anisodus tanguticus]
MKLTCFLLHQLYRKCGEHECSVGILEDYLKNHPTEADISVIHLLAVIHMEGNAHLKALDLIECAKQRYFTGKQMPLNLSIKAGICHLHLGHIEEAEVCLSLISKFLVAYRSAITHSNFAMLSSLCNVKADQVQCAVQDENASQHPDIVTEVADSLMTLEYHESALKYYMMLEGDDYKNKGYLHLGIAECYVFLRERVQAIEYFYKAVNELEDSVDARLTLSSILLEEGKDDEAVSVLSPPKESESSVDSSSGEPKSWWLNSKIKLKLCQIYRAKGSLEACVDVIFPLIRETLFLKSVQPKEVTDSSCGNNLLQKCKLKILWAKVANHAVSGVELIKSHRKEAWYCQNDTTGTVTQKRFGVAGVMQGGAVLLKQPTFFAHSHGESFNSENYNCNLVDHVKSCKSKKSASEERDVKGSKKKAAALAAGADWKSDDSDSESPGHVYREPPLPDLLKDEEHLGLIVDLCKSLISLQRYWDALEIINLRLKLASSTLSVEKRGELQALGAHKQRCMLAETFFFYLVEVGYNIADPIRGFDCARSIVSQHPYSFAAWNCYYKVISRYQQNFYQYSEHSSVFMVGSALINVALGFRLQNKHQCVLQGLAFLYNNLRLSGNRQELVESLLPEALYNVGRACHHVGLVSLAVIYYQRVLDTHEDDYPIPKLPNENPDPVENRKPGYCDLHREAAYNLHLIYKNSGAHDLARQILKDYCTV